jgi:hypothetical protein
MVGTWGYDADLFRLAVPAAVLADDDERLEWMRAMTFCASTLNNKDALMMPDDPDED